MFAQLIEGIRLEARSKEQQYRGTAAMAKSAGVGKATDTDRGRRIRAQTSAGVHARSSKPLLKIPGSRKKMRHYPTGDEQIGQMGTASEVARKRAALKRAAPKSKTEARSKEQQRAGLAAVSGGSKISNRIGNVTRRQRERSRGEGPTHPAVPSGSAANRHRDYKSALRAKALGLPMSPGGHADVHGKALARAQKKKGERIRRNNAKERIRRSNIKAGRQPDRGWKIPRKPGAMPIPGPRPGEKVAEELSLSSPSHPENRRKKDQARRAAAKKEIMQRWNQPAKNKPVRHLAQLGMDIAKERRGK